MVKVFYSKKVTPSNKKYSVITPKGRLIHFGARGYEHYFDRFGKYSHLNHLDKERRRLYRLRHSKVRDKYGFAYKNKESPAYYSYRYLW